MESHKEHENKKVDTGADDRTIEEKLQELEINETFLFQALHQLSSLKQELENTRRITVDKIAKRTQELEERAGDMQWQLEVLKEKKRLEEQKRSTVDEAQASQKESKRKN